MNPDEHVPTEGEQFGQDPTLFADQKIHSEVEKKVEQVTVQSKKTLIFYVLLILGIVAIVVLFVVGIILFSTKDATQESVVQKNSLATPPVQQQEIETQLAPYFSSIEEKNPETDVLVFPPMDTVGKF